MTTVPGSSLFGGVAACRMTDPAPVSDGVDAFSAGSLSWLAASPAAAIGVVRDGAAPPAAGVRLATRSRTVFAARGGSLRDVERLRERAVRKRRRQRAAPEPAKRLARKRRKHDARAVRRRRRVQAGSMAMRGP